MRLINGLICAVLILFAAAQYNDPDALLWGAIYGIAALWTGLAAFRPGHLARPPLRALWALCTVAGLAGVVWYWPDTPNWWLKDVWWESETSREGMGMMVVALALLLAGAQMALRRTPR